MTVNAINCEVLVLGAGLIGLMAALLLKRSGVNVPIVDKRAAPSSEASAGIMSARLVKLCALLEWRTRYAPKSRPELVARGIPRGALACLTAVIVAHAGPGAAALPARNVEGLADRYVAQLLAFDPTVADESGVPSRVHDRFPDRTPGAFAAFQATERHDLADLLAIVPGPLPLSARATYANLRETLESDLQLRVCKAELWNVNHFSGWQSTFGDVAEQQPVATAADRADALKRWATLPRFVDVEIANLRRGLAQGYSAPQSVVRRVIAQMDGFVKGKAEDLPYDSPAARSDDQHFRAAFRRVLADAVVPALARYRDFLVGEYLDRARPSIALSDLPDGAACYRAFLRSYTSLDRTPQEVYELGRRTVAANEADVRTLGRRAYDTDDLPALVARINADPAERFRSREELLAFSRGLIGRAKACTAAVVIARMPAQDAVVEPERSFEDDAGVSSHYVPETDGRKTARFAIELGNFATETRADAEITAVHELWPGHHLQISLARELQPPTAFSRIAGVSAYQEGWARYAEGMAEEAGVYADKAAPILRRLWPARGMVVDPGLHAFGWTRQRAVDYMVASGRFDRKEAEDTVDRIAVMPGQLTAYDTGGLTIRALRQQARDALGARFDLKAFNLAVLEEGAVPLGELKLHVAAWLADEARRGAPAKAR